MTTAFHSTTHAHHRAVPRALPVRVLGAGLLVAMAVIHLQVWSDGYKHIHVIGPLFLLDGVLGIACALAVLVAPGRLLPLAALAGGLLELGTLGGLVQTVQSGLFGFRETWQAPHVMESVWVEVAGAVLLLGYGGMQLLRARRRASSG